MRKLDKLALAMNDDFRDYLSKAFAERWPSVDIKHEWSFFADRLVTTRVDGEDFTPEQHAFIAAWSDGYGCALRVVRMAD